MDDNASEKSKIQKISQVNNVIYSIVKSMVNQVMNQERKWN